MWTFRISKHILSSGWDSYWNAGNLSPVAVRNMHGLSSISSAWHFSALGWILRSMGILFWQFQRHSNEFTFVEMSLNPQSDFSSTFRYVSLPRIYRCGYFVSNLQQTHIFNHWLYRIPNPINMKCLVFVTNSPFADLPKPERVRERERRWEWENGEHAKIFHYWNY